MNSNCFLLDISSNYIQNHHQVKLLHLPGTAAGNLVLPVNTFNRESLKIILDDKINYKEYAENMFIMFIK